MAVAVAHLRAHDAHPNDSDGGVRTNMHGTTAAAVKRVYSGRRARGADSQHKPWHTVGGRLPDGSYAFLGRHAVSLSPASSQDREIRKNRQRVGLFLSLTSVLGVFLRVVAQVVAWVIGAANLGRRLQHSAHDVRCPNLC